MRGANIDLLVVTPITKVGHIAFELAGLARFVDTRTSSYNNLLRVFKIILGHLNSMFNFC